MLQCISPNARHFEFFGATALPVFTHNSEAPCTIFVRENRQQFDDSWHPTVIRSCGRLILRFCCFLFGGKVSANGANDWWQDRHDDDENDDFLDLLGTEDFA